MSYELYVASDLQRPHQLCAGSRLCVTILEHLPDEYVTIINCDDARRMGRTLPSWVTGTPTLMPTDGGDIYRGHDAVLHMVNLSISYREHVVSDALRKESAKVSKPTAMRRNANPSRAVPGATPGATTSGARLPPPPPPGDDEDMDMAELWSSAPPPDDDSEDFGNTRKLTSDDLNRAVQQRQQSGFAPIPNGAPPPPPPQEKD